MEKLKKYNEENDGFITMAKDLHTIELQISDMKRQIKYKDYKVTLCFINYFCMFR